MSVLKTLDIIWMILVDRARTEKAYAANIISELASTMLYTITFIIFIELLFKRVGSIADYSKSDMLFMMLVGQFTFYVWSQVIATAMNSLVEKVRDGSFDFMLLRPFSVRTLLYAGSVKPLYTVMTSLPTFAVISIFIDWGSINIDLSSFFVGLVVWLCGIAILTLIMLSLTIPVFVWGDATNLISASFGLFAFTEQPFNKLPQALRWLSFAALPTLLLTGGVSYIILQKGPYFGLVLVPALVAGSISALAYHRLWRYALRQYSSASS